ncbi:MAG: hypothetical protein J0I20_16450 [Chloroflexi bacterium]|nr:hypothetical protein [Chloroflexota bacterium]OJV88736.1 MAG: hypothetical protein BGO39_04335 [Chloroflexi bacterium 54-19]
MDTNEEARQDNNVLPEVELSETDLNEVSGGTAKDNLSDMNTQDMGQLQAAMDKKSQLEQMISNTVKANSQTTSGIVSNLKSS